MESLYILIPLSIAFIGLIAWVLSWAIKSDQFDDLQGPGEAILLDDDAPTSLGDDVSKKLSE